MFWLIYNVLLIVSFPIIFGLLLSRKRCQRGLMARLGTVPTVLKHLSEPVVWVHAVSLGEVTAVVPLLKAMKAKNSHQTIIVSTVTETGREMVLKQLEGIAIHCYAPLDFWWVVKRYVRMVKPRLFLLVESEIWPNLLTCLEQHQVPMCLVNGRISSRSFSRYQLVKRLMKGIWSSLDMALMQTAQDAERIKELGVNPNVVYVTGNMKFDQSFEHSESIASSKDLRTSLGIRDSELVIVAGSTHKNEEDQLLEAYQSLCQSVANVVLIMAPRHIERASELEAVVAQYGMKNFRRSERESGKIIDAPHQSSRVIILDTRGELPYVYRLGFICFVGGTLVPVGGHNLLEPAQWGRPVLFGPYVDHCQESADQLLETGGALQILQAKDLVENLLHFVKHPAEAEQMGRKALSVVQENRGVVKKNLQLIRELSIDKQPPPGSIVPGKSSSIKTPNIVGNRF